MIDQMSIPLYPTCVNVNLNLSIGNALLLSNAAVRV